MSAGFPQNYASTTIPSTLTQRLVDLWKRVLYLTRYSQLSSAGMDGTTFEFSAGNMHGECWSPKEEGAPLHLVRAANALRHVSESLPEDRSEALDQLENLLVVLEHSLEELDRKAT